MFQNVYTYCVEKISFSMSKNTIIGKDKKKKEYEKKERDTY